MSIKTTIELNISPPIHHQHRQYIAVQLPEVVSHILSYLAPYDSLDPTTNSSDTNPRNKKHLYQCLLINHLWYECSLRHLWRHVLFDGSHSDTLDFHQFARAFSNKLTIHSLASPIPTSYSSSAYLFFPSPASSTPYDLTKKESPTPSLCTPLSVQSTQLRHSSILPPPSPSLPPPLPPPSPSLPPPLPPPSQSTDLHHKSLRSLTLRNIKGPNATASLKAIADHATHLQRLDLYIGSYVTNESLTPFFTHTPSCLTHVSLPGCQQITDASILVLAHHTPDLVHLDLRACHLVSDIGITAIAKSCSRLYHLNVGRIHKHHHITDQSIALVAQQCSISVLGLAGCDITDTSMLALAIYRRHALERVSVNQCHRLTNYTIQALVSFCSNITVFEMKGCLRINDWRAIESLVDRKVSLRLGPPQKIHFQQWSRQHGKNRTIKTPIKRP